MGSSGAWVVPGLVVDLVTKTRGINNGERDPRALLIKLELCTASQSSVVLYGAKVVLIRTNCHGLDLDAVLDVGAVGVIRVLVADHRLSAESVDEGGPAWKSPRSCQQAVCIYRWGLGWGKGCIDARHELTST